MKRKKVTRHTKGKRPIPRGAKGSTRRTTSWADPTLPLHKISKRGKIKSNPRDRQKKSCWWFG